MGRLWLALVLLGTLFAPAFAYQPHVPEPTAPPPAAPRVTSASLEVGAQRTSTGLYDVERLHLEATFAPSVIRVRISIGSLDAKSTIETTPDHLDLVRPPVPSPLGAVRIYVVGVDADQRTSPSAAFDVVAQRYHPIRCGSPFALLFLAIPLVYVLIVIGALLAMRAREARRTSARLAAEPSGIALPAAEDHIRAVALRALLAIVLVTAILVVSITAALASTDDLLFIPIFGGPLLAVIALTAILRVVNAGRAIALLHRPGAAASTRFDQLEVSAGGRQVTLRSSPRLVERARRRALPRATL